MSETGRHSPPGPAADLVASPFLAALLRSRVTPPPSAAITGNSAAGDAEAQAMALEERIAIMTIDGGLPEAEARAIALGLHPSP